MTEDQIRKVLSDHKAGTVSDDDAIARFRDLPFQDLGFANVDHHRTLRQGFPEVIFGAGKSPEQVVRKLTQADRMMAEGMEARVPNLEKVVIPNCGHWTQQERPDETNAAMLRYLERLTRW